MIRKLVFTALVMIFLIPAAAFSQDSAEEGKLMTEKAMMTGKGIFKQGKKDKMSGRHAKMGMCGMMMNRSLVATEDGGVVVLAGNKLLKYDRDLNLLKEVELKVEPAAMPEMMKGMAGDCPYSSDKKIPETTP